MEQALYECIMWVLISSLIAVCIVGVGIFILFAIGVIADYRNELAEESLRKALEKELEQ